jgi:hypothetical protein
MCVLCFFMVAGIGACGGGGGGGGYIPDDQEEEKNQSGDFLPPELTEANPSNGAEQVSPYSVITLTFSEKIDPDTINSQSITVKNICSKGFKTPIFGEISYDKKTCTASFAPDVPLPYSGNVHVKLRRSIRDLAGNRLESKAEVSFDVLDKPKPVRLSEHTSAYHRKQAAVFNDKGEGLLLWQVENGRETRILYSHFHSGIQKWEPEQEFVPDDPGASDPAVATNGDQFMAVWISGKNRVMARLFTYHAWEPAIELTTNNAGYWPGIASNGSGFMAIWYRSGHIFARKYTPEDGWGISAQLDKGDEVAHYPKIARSHAGYCAVWSKQNAVYAALSSGSGTGWHPETYLGQSNYGHEVQIAPMCTGSNASGCTVIWRDKSNRLYSGIYNIYTNTWTLKQICQLSCWSAKFHLSQNGYQNVLALVDQKSGKHGLSVLSLIMMPPDQFVWFQSYFMELGYDQVDSLKVAGYYAWCAVTWRQHNGSEYDIHAWVYPDNQGQPSKVLDIAKDDCMSPHITLKDKLDFIVTWDQTSFDGLGRLHRARFKKDQGWYYGHGALFDGSYYGDCRNPKMAVDASGRTLAVWSQFHRNTWPVYGCFLEEGVWGSPFMIAEGAPYPNIYMVNPLVPNPLVASDGSGFMVAWYGYLEGQTALVTRIFSHDSWAEPEITNTDYVYSGFDLCSNGTSYALTWMQRVDKNGAFKLGAVARIHQDSAWSDLVKLELDEGDIHTKRVSTNGTGYAFVWSQYDGTGGAGNLCLRAHVFDGTTWSGAETIVTEANDIYSWDLASDGTGYAVKTQESARRHDGKSWLPTEQVPLNQMKKMSLSSNGSGYAVAWSAWGGNPPDEIYLKSFDGEAWSGAQLMEKLYGPVGAPSLASNGTGYALVWANSEDLLSGLFVNRYHRTGWTGVNGLIYTTAEVFGLQTVPANQNYGAIWTEESEEEPITRCVRVAVGF